MTETDLVTAGGSPEQAELPNTVNSPQDSNPAAADAPSDVPAADPAPTADVTTDATKGSLSAMVLPELRALANSVGVKGASGMRKSELIAAIRESRGESVGNASDAPKPADKAEKADKAEAKGEKAEKADKAADAKADKKEKDEKKEKKATRSELPVPMYQQAWIWMVLLITIGLVVAFFYYGS